ncbi:hypothetical protein JMJ35_002970 [Cladonia borealis]|uniref:Rhodopsin domain-containing protein n=1 Tax=Cladonia borealis TaxID=184061 RepID=A0AA39R3T0_9LECA|nr:hypothetical protein JMJ35_002970 [Cladonia borealis]
MTNENHLSPGILKPFTAGLVVITVINVVRGGTITLIKVALQHFYLTIFGADNAFGKVTYAIMALIVGLGIGWCLEAVLVWRPLRKDWDPQTPEGYRSNKNGVLVGGLLNVVTDFAMIVLPIPMVWRLQMVPQRNIALTFVFGLGFTVCGVSVLQGVVGSRLEVVDSTYSEAEVDIITHLEAFLAIIVACLPIFLPTLKRTLHGKSNADTGNVNLEGGTGTRDEINGLDSKGTSSLNDPMGTKRAVHTQSTTNVKPGL